MKKVLFAALALAIGMTGFAQKVTVNKSEIANKPVKMAPRVMLGTEAAPAMNFSQEVMTKASSTNSLRGYDESQIMTTYYDLQSNSALGNRIATWDDGSAAVVMTWDNTGTTSYGNRGTGYNFYDGTAFGDEPDNRIEDAYAGWPSIAPLGDGEIVASHYGSKVHIFKRDVKGEGEWTNIYDSEINATWPRIATTGNGQYVHLICDEQVTTTTPSKSYAYYARSTDGGQTFSELAYPPLVDVEGMYKNDISADDYVMATNGDNIAILFGSNSYDLFYIISHDNGETWEKQVIWNYPYDHAWDMVNDTYNPATDSIWAPDGSHSIAIDNNGTVHVAFGLIRWAPADQSASDWEPGQYSYWPYTDGIVYWNSNYTNEQGGHEIPNFGDWSGDARLIQEDPNWLLNGTDGISNTLNSERIWAMAGEDNYQNLYVISAPDENGDGEVNFTDAWDNTNFHYRSHCISTMPGISIDEQGNMIIVYSTLSENRIHAEANVHFRSAYVTVRDQAGTWFENGYNLSGTFMHQYSEVYPTTANPKGQNGSFWIAYSEDENPGLYLDYTAPGGTSTPNNNNLGVLTENFIYAVKLTPTAEDLPGYDGVEENDAINPMTGVRVYPNPATDVLNIEVNASTSSEMNICVYNLMGQKVMESNTTINAGMNCPSINTAELNSGIYFVTVKANGFDQTMKFIVK